MIAQVRPMCQGQISFQKAYKWAMEPEARNRTRTSFCACPGRQQL